MLRTKSNRLICSSSFRYGLVAVRRTSALCVAAGGQATSPALTWLAADRVRDALLGEAGLCRAREFLVGGGGIAGRCGVGLALLHEAGERRTGEFLVGRLRLAGRLRLRRCRLGMRAACQDAENDDDDSGFH